MANYEAFRAMYEGRNAQLFHPTTAIITWMSNPAQPSFVWQLYHYDLEPNASLFAVMHASEMVHIQLNEANGQVQVINNQPEPVTDAVARVDVYNLDGTLAYEHETKLTAAPDAATNLGTVDFPRPSVSAVHFLKLALHNAAGELLSSNFYWLGLPDHPGDLTALNELPTVTLTAKAEELEGKIAGQRLLAITLHNPTHSIALMAHVQLRRKSGERVLPVFYSDNYVSLVPNETKTIDDRGRAKRFQRRGPADRPRWLECDGSAGVIRALPLRPISKRSPTAGLQLDCRLPPRGCDKSAAREHRKTRNQWLRASGLRRILSLHSRPLLPLRLGVKADQVVLLVVVPDAAHEDAEGLVALLFQKLVACLVEVLRDLVGAWAPACPESSPPRRCGRR